MFTNKARIASYHLSHASGHQLQDAVVEVVVERRVKHHRALCLEGCGFFGAAHMQQLKPVLRDEHRCGVAKERGGMERTCTHTFSDTFCMKSDLKATSTASWGSASRVSIGCCRHRRAP